MQVISAANWVCSESLCWRSVRRSPTPHTVIAVQNLPLCCSDGLLSRHVFAICPPQKHTRFFICPRGCIQRGADVSQPRPVDVHTDRGLSRTSGAALLAERDQYVHGHVGYEILECGSLTSSGSPLLPFGRVGARDAEASGKWWKMSKHFSSLLRWVLCHAWSWFWISVNRTLWQESGKCRQPDWQVGG